MEAVAETSPVIDQYIKMFAPPIEVIETDEREGYVKFSHPLGSSGAKEVREAFLTEDPKSPASERSRTFNQDGKVSYGRILRGGEVSLDIFPVEQIRLQFGFNGGPAGPTIAVAYKDSKLVSISIGKPVISRGLAQELEERSRIESSFLIFKREDGWHYGFGNTDSAELLRTLSTDVQKPESQLSYQITEKNGGGLTIIGTDLTSGLKTTFEAKGGIDLKYWQDMLYSVEDKSWEDCLKQLPVSFSAIS